MPNENVPKKPRRKRTKYPALNKSYNTRVRQEYIDQDYLDQLSAKELEWLNKFMEEYLNASFNRDETDIQPYEKYGKDSNDRNNSRNRCLYGALKNKDNKFNNKKLVNYDNIVNDIELKLIAELNPKNIENNYIEYLDLKQMEELEKYAQELDELEDYAENLDREFED